MAAVVVANGRAHGMRNLFTLILIVSLFQSARAIPDSGFRIPIYTLLVPHSASPVPHSPSLIPAKKKFFDTTVSERGWVARFAYNRQETNSWGEFGFGRMARLQHYDFSAKGTTVAAASFTFGADIGYDSSLIIGPKLSMEFSSILFGGRVGYGYYMQDGNSSGVIGLEGGFNIVSVFFVYAGYNFVKGNSETPVVTEGAKFSIGFNYPIGMRRVPPPKRPSHL